MVGMTCSLCSVFCRSVRNLADHVAGTRHKTRLKCVASEELKHEGRLYYYLENYFENVPVLGLEYVLERQEDSGYRYTCTLCKREYSWGDMALHITSGKHMGRYMYKHHSELISGSTTEERSLVLTNAARTIPTKFGCGKKYTYIPTTVANPPTQEAGMKNGDPPSTIDGSLTEHVMTEEGLDPTMFPQERNSAASGVNIYYCSLCNISCVTPRTLCYHVLGKKHELKLMCAAPEQLKDVGRLGYVLNYLEDYPILGLEYIVEIGPGPRYKFTCQLCSVNAPLPGMVAHFTDIDHTVSYIRKHHCDMFSSLKNFTNKLHYMKNLREVSARILERHGRKEFQSKFFTDGDLTESLPEGEGQTRKPVEVEGVVSPSKHDSVSSVHSKRRPSPYRGAGLDKRHESFSCNTVEENSNSDGSPTAKRGRLFPEGAQDALPSSAHTSKYGGSSYNERLDYTRAEQELEFRTNDQFLQYLANFSIDDHEGVLFVQKITQNCIKALTSFREEEIERQKSIYWAEAS